MSISYVELKNTLPELKEHLIGRHINKFIAFCNDTYTFSLGKKETGIFCLRNSNPFIGYTDEMEHYQSLNDSNIQLLKKELSNFEIINIELKEDDRVLTLEVEGINEIFKTETKYLVFELIPGKANFFILDDSKKIIFALKGCSDGRITLKNASYIYPKCSPFKMTENDKKVNFESLTNELLAIRTKEKYHDLMNYVSSRIKISNSKIEKISQDIEKAKSHLNDGQIGEMILMNLDKIKYKDKELLIDDYSIHLNPRLKPYENANYYFKQAKKAKATLAQANINIERAISEKNSFDHISNLLSSATEQELELIIKEFELETIAQKGKKCETSAAVSSSINPFFFKYEDTTVLFGKSAKQNDYLTFFVDTSKKHYWMHIIGNSGTHLMICSENPSGALIKLCGEILCYASKQQDGEVMLTKRENVRKGQNPGQVSVKEYKTFRINNVSQQAIAMYMNAKKK